MYLTALIFTVLQSMESFSSSRPIDRTGPDDMEILSEERWLFFLIYVCFIFPVVVVQPKRSSATDWGWYLIMLQNKITYHVSFELELYKGTACVLWALPSSIRHQDSSPSLLGMVLRMLTVQTWKEVNYEAPEPAHSTQGTAGPVSPGLWVRGRALFFVLCSYVRAVQPHSALLRWQFLSTVIFVGRVVLVWIKGTGIKMTFYFSQIAPEWKQKYIV